MMGGLYSAALRDGTLLEVVYPDGRRLPVPVDHWRGPLRSGDESVLDRCAAPTLDVGCGPGRLTVALLARGIDAAGVDVDETAVRMARRAGAVVHRQSVFDSMPREGRWATGLLIDGSVGINGDPVALLKRVRELMRPSGVALVEVEPPPARSELLRLRLRSGDRLSRPFPWARLALCDASTVAAAAGLEVVDTWQEAGRCFVALRRA